MPYATLGTYRMNNDDDDDDHQMYTQVNATLNYVNLAVYCHLF